MKLKLPILDLSDVDWGEQVRKIIEEFDEFLESKNQSKHELSEALDLIQTTIGLIRISFTPEEIQQGVERHYNKLQGRDRAIIGEINISVEVD
jgi:predicted house-cleaning noncanonical NTP pyrophosphatase (MazG superfamily)